MNNDKYNETEKIWRIETKPGNSGDETKTKQQNMNDNNDNRIKLQLKKAAKMYST